MKIINRIILIFFSAIGLLVIIGSGVVYSQSVSCPQPNDSDILRIHSFLTSQEFQAQRSRSNIKHYSFDLNDLERQHTEAFRKYWKEKGVFAISDPELCEKITDVLNSKTNIKGLLNDFIPLFYHVEDQYVILYRSKQNRNRIEQGQLPVQVLDEELNIISYFRI